MYHAMYQAVPKQRVPFQMLAQVHVFGKPSREASCVPKVFLFVGFTLDITAGQLNYFYHKSRKQLLFS